MKKIFLAALFLIFAIFRFPPKAILAQTSRPFELGDYEFDQSYIAELKSAGANTAMFWGYNCSTLQAVVNAGFMPVVKMPFANVNDSESSWRSFISNLASCPNSDKIIAWYIEALEKPAATKNVGTYLKNYYTSQGKQAPPFRAHIDKHADDYLPLLRMPNTEFAQYCVVDEFYEGLYFKYGGLPIVANRAWDEKLLGVCPGTKLIAHPQFFSGKNGSFGGGSGSDFPTKEEFLAETYTHLIAGASGIVIYAWEYGRNSVNLVDGYKTIVNQLLGTSQQPEQLGRVLLEGQRQTPGTGLAIQSGPANTPQIYSGGPTYPSIFYTARVYNGNYYLLAVNHASSAVGASFTSLPVANGTAMVLFENRQLTISGGSLSDDFAVNAVHVYKFPVTGGPTPTSTPSCTKSGDVNCDGLINAGDIRAVISSYGTSTTGVPADLNRDGTVNIIDIGIVIDQYGL